MNKHFLVFGILLYVLFERVYDIFVLVLKIIGEKQNFNSLIVYILLGLCVAIPILLFFIIIKKMPLNFNNLILLIIVYVLSFFILYLLNKQIGTIMADNLEMIQRPSQMSINVIGLSKTLMVFVKIVVLSVLSVASIRSLTRNQQK